MAPTLWIRAEHTVKGVSMAPTLWIRAEHTGIGVGKSACPGTVPIAPAVQVRAEHTVMGVGKSACPGTAGVSQGIRALRQWCLQRNLCADGAWQCTPRLYACPHTLPTGLQSIRTAMSRNMHTLSASAARLHGELDQAPSAAAAASILRAVEAVWTSAVPRPRVRAGLMRALKHWLSHSPSSSGREYSTTDCKPAMPSRVQLSMSCICMGGGVHLCR